MFQIGVLDANDQLIETVLDNTTFYLRLSWNEAGRLWTLGLQNAEGDALLSGASVRPGTFLFRQFRRRFMPLGELMVDTVVGGTVLDRAAFRENRAALFYLEEADFEDAGALNLLGRL